MSLRPGTTPDRLREQPSGPVLSLPLVRSTRAGPETRRYCGLIAIISHPPRHGTATAHGEVPDGAADVFTDPVGEVGGGEWEGGTLPARAAVHARR